MVSLYTCIILYSEFTNLQKEGPEVIPINPSRIVVGGTRSFFRIFYLSWDSQIFIWAEILYSFFNDESNAELNAEPNIESYAWDLNIGSKPRI